MRKPAIAIGCVLMLAMLASGIFVYTTVQSVVQSVAAITIQLPTGNGFGEFYRLSIIEVVARGDRQQKLLLLESIQKAGPQNGQQLALWIPLLEPLMQDTDDEVRTMARKVLPTVDPTTLDRANGPPAPSLPRDSQ